jgi:hypothetical protein
MKDIYEWTIEQELSDSYLILRVENKKVEDYQVKMLQKNAIPNVLTIRTMVCEDTSSIVYPISGKLSLLDYAKENGVGYELLRNIIETLTNIISVANEFLLYETGFQIDGNLIFIDPKTISCFYVYVPCEKNGSKNVQLLRSLIELLIKYILKNDEKAISLIHKFRMVLEEGNFNVSMLKTVIEYEEDMVFMNPGPQIQRIDNDMDNNDIGIRGTTKYRTSKKQQRVSKDAKLMFIILQGFIGIIIFLCSAHWVGAADSYSNRLIKVIAIIAIVGICEALIFFKVLFQKEFITNEMESDSIIWEEKNMMGIMKSEGIKKNNDKAKKTFEKKDRLISTNNIEKDVLIIKKDKKEKSPQRFFRGDMNKEESRVRWKWENTNHEQSERNFIQKRAYWVDEQEVNIPLLKTPFIIGSMKGVVDFQVKNESASRIHCQITCEDDQYYIIDLNSKNGTFLNNRKLEGQEKYLLKNTDEIKIINDKYYFKLY